MLVCSLTTWDCWTSNAWRLRKATLNLIKDFSITKSDRYQHPGIQPIISTYLSNGDWMQMTSQRTYLCPDLRCIVRFLYRSFESTKPQDTTSNMRLVCSACWRGARLPSAWLVVRTSPTNSHSLLDRLTGLFPCPSFEMKQTSLVHLCIDVINNETKLNAVSCMTDIGKQNHPHYIKVGFLVRC